MNLFTFIGLEFHNNRMWKWASVEKALDFMEEFGMNALIFHQNDIIDQVVLPEKYFTEEEMWAYWPIRYCNIGSRGRYLARLLDECERRKIDFYLEVKEIWYPEAILDQFPGLRNEEGHICPTDPFWFPFFRDKITELLEKFPTIKGIIVSPATRESKISIAAGQCHCERCKKVNEKEWYQAYLQAIYGALAERGKKLVVRDFAYEKDSQNAVVEAAEECSREIVIALKNVPHDFWPTFPNNPAIRKETALEKWIEYDVWGQYCGLGVFPCSLLEDISYRQKYCLEHGSSGIWYRTDWELLDEGSCFNSLNLLNLIGAVMYARNPDCSRREIYEKFLKYGLHTAWREESSRMPPQYPVGEHALEQMVYLMESSREIILKTLYVRGHVFSYSSRYQHSYQSIYNVMNVYHKRYQWDEASRLDILPTKDNLALIYQEKEEALELARSLAENFHPEDLGVADWMCGDLKEMLYLFPMYVEGFYLSAKVYFGSGYWMECADGLEVLKKDLDSLRQFCIRLRSVWDHSHYPFYVYWMMDVGELECLAADIEKKTGGSLWAG